MEDCRPRGVDTATGSDDPVTVVLTELLDRVRHIERVLDLVPILLAAHGDPTHLAVPDAARALGVSVRTIRRKIARGELTLERVADGRKTGIPIEQIYARWIPLHVSRKSMVREKGRLRATS
jgi:excisionase family DNA binding protein